MTTLTKHTEMNTDVAEIPFTFTSSNLSLVVKNEIECLYRTVKMFPKGHTRAGFVRVIQV